MSVPVIDLANFPAETEKLIAAAAGPGCFRVINHGISPSIMADMKACVGGLFNLPSEVKRRNTDVITGSGYLEPYRCGPLHEGLGIYDAASPDNVDTFCSHLSASFRGREILSAYASKAHGLLAELASKIADGLGITGCSFQDWPCILRMNRYNFTEETVGSCGLPIHTDPCFITALFEDEFNNGLEIVDSAGNFVAIDPMPGTFFINIGDIGQAWSNGRLYNMKHRVICKKGEPRISIALFMLAPKDNKVEPRADLIDSLHPQLYRSFDYSVFRKLRFFSQLINGEALLNWAVDGDAAMA